MKTTDNISISVLLPVYNAEKHIAEAVNSILNQTYPDFELIILNDGCTDDTINIVNSFSDSRIRIEENVKNMGLIATLNKGIQVAKGTFIARMDADDIALPKRFERQIEIFHQNAEIGVVGTNIETFGTESKCSDLPITNEEIQLVKYFSNPIAHPTAMIRRSILNEHQIVYRNELLHLEDWGLWMDLSKKTAFYNLKEPLLKYRLEGQNITVKNHESLKSRMFVFYKIYLADLFGKVDDELCEKHWCFVKAKYQPETDWIQLMETYTSAFVKKGVHLNVIESYFDSISEELFYGMASISPKKALSFAKKRGILTRQKRVYAIKKMLKP